MTHELLNESSAFSAVESCSGRPKSLTAVITAVISAEMFRHLFSYGRKRGFGGIIADSVICAMGAVVV